MTHSTPPPELDRADSELTRRVRLFIEQRRVAGGARLSIQASGGAVTLRGTAASFHQRQLLYSIARRVAGVQTVIDELDVELPSSRPSSPLRGRPLSASEACPSSLG